MQGAQFIGPILILLSAACFAMNTPSAPFFYGDGGNAAALVVARSATAALVGLALFSMRRRQTILPSRREAVLIAWMSVTFFAQGLCYLASVAYIPVSLAALIFFTWPIVAALMAPLFGFSKATLPQLGLFTVAFAGLAVALGPDAQGLDWRGVALAFSGGVCIATFLLLTKKAVDTLSASKLCFWNNGGIALLGVVLMSQTTGLDWPGSGHTTGWWALAAVCLFFSMGVLLQLVGVRRTESKTTALLFNLEPVISILAAVLLLSERLTLVQAGGATLVLATVVLFTLTQRAPKNGKRGAAAAAPRPLENK